MYDCSVIRICLKIIYSCGKVFIDVSKLYIFIRLVKEVMNKVVVDCFWIICFIFLLVCLIMMFFFI